MTSVFKRTIVQPPRVPGASHAAPTGGATAPAVQETLPLLPGTRRWLDGQLLLSTGHAELDAVLGGGVPIGASLLLEEDAHAGHAHTLMQLMTAEGIACGQRITIGCTHAAVARRQLSRLPLNASRDSRDTAAALARATQGATAPSTEVKYGHTFDLSRSVHPDVLAASSIQVVEVTSTSGTRPGVQSRPRTGSVPGSTPPASRRDSRSGASLLPASPQPHTRPHAGDRFADLYTRLCCSLIVDGDTPLCAGRLIVQGLGSSAWPGGGASGDAISAAAMLWAAAATTSTTGPAQDVFALTRGMDADLLPPAGEDRSERVYAPLLRFIAALKRDVAATAQPRSVAPAPLIARAPAPAPSPARTPVPAPSLVMARPPPLPPGGNARSPSPAALNVGAVTPTPLGIRSPATPVSAPSPPPSPAAAPPAVSRTCTPTALFVSMPLHTMPPAVAASVRALFDIVIKVHAFSDPWYAAAQPSRVTALLPGGAPAKPAGSNIPLSTSSGTAPEFADYNGLLVFKKLPRVGSAGGPSPDTLTYVFKRDRKKLVIDKPHLPPEGELAGSAPSRGAPGESYAVSADTDEMDAVVSMPDDADAGARRTGMGCASSGSGGGGSSSIDF